MKVTYNGPHPEVVVDEFDQEAVIVKGQPVDVPDDLAARLLEQNTWEPAEKKAEKVQGKIDQAQADADKAEAEAAQAKADADKAAAEAAAKTEASAGTESK